MSEQYEDTQISKAEATISKLQESIARISEMLEDAKICKNQMSKSLLVQAVNRQLAKYITTD